MVNKRDRAYPVAVTCENNPNRLVAYEDGLTKRELVAAVALQGMLAHSTRYKPRNPDQHWHQAIAEEAIELADALLEAL